MGKRGPPAVRRKLRDTWDKIQDHIYLLGKTEPKTFLYGSLAVLTYYTIGQVLRVPFRSPLPQSEAQDAEDAAQAVVNHLWLTPWFPYLVAEKTVQDISRGFTADKWVSPDLLRDAIKLEFSSYVALGHREDVPAVGYPEWVWSVPEVPRVMLQIRLAVLPLFALEAAGAIVGAFGQVLQGVGAIVPG